MFSCFIGDAVVDGKTIEWEKRKRFEGMTEEEIAGLSVKDYDTLEEERMRKNCWDVSKELTRRIDGAPVLGEFIHCQTSVKSEDMYFFNKDVLKQYIDTTSIVNRDRIPGSGYIAKIYSFIEQHYIQGEMFVEYCKGWCAETLDGELCTFCASHPAHGTPIKRVPGPYPDVSKLPEHHYLAYKNTPLVDENGATRQVDDFAPRPNLKKLFKSEAISLQEEHSSVIDEFSNKFIVSRPLVVNYLTHLTNMKRVAGIRQRERDQIRITRDQKTYEDYNWQGRYQNGTLAKLVVSELNKYLEYHNLSLIGNKVDKVRRITAHICSELADELGEQSDVDDEDQEEEEDNLGVEENEVEENSGGEEEIQAEVNSENSEYESDTEDEDEIEIQLRSRYSGRIITRKTYGSDFL